MALQSKKFCASHETMILVGGGEIVQSAVVLMQQ